jgi:MFS family permease
VTSTGASGPPPPAGDSQAPSARRIRLHGWRHPAILALAATAMASGFAQFAATAALGDIARAFGKETGAGGSVVAEVGLSGTTLGVGLAIIRLASLGAMPLAALADRHGRRRVLLGTVTAGLAVTAIAALSPGYWWFVALFALARPLLSTTNALDAVVAAEETETRDRAKAIALVTAGYGIGAGLNALVRGVAGEGLGFRGLFALALVPLAATPLLARKLEEPDRYQRLRVAADPAAAVQPRVLGRIRADLRPRLRLLAVLAFAIAFVTGPANTFLFVYAENALGMSRSATAAMFLVAGPVGLAGLLLGRWATDTLGRRRTAGGTQAVVALACMLTYSGSRPAVVAGYLLGILAASAYGPSFGALSAELFPTSVRATVAGWLFGVAGVVGAVTGLVAFGRLADVLASFHGAAVLVAAPVVLASLLFARLPETRGRELEQTAPE